MKWSKMKAMMLFLLQCVCFGYSSVSTMHIQEEICQSGTASLKIEVLRKKGSMESVFIPQIVFGPPRKKRSVILPRPPILATCASGNKYVVKVLEVLNNAANIDIPDDRIISVFHTNSMLQLSSEYFVTVTPYKNCVEREVIASRDWGSLNKRQKKWLHNNTYRKNCGEMKQCFGKFKPDFETFRCLDKFSYCATIKGRRKLKKSKKCMKNPFTRIPRS